MFENSFKFIWILVGWASLLIGFIGIFIPVLPTTPFVILSAFCFSKGSPRLHKWLLGLPKIGPIIIDWQKRRVIAFKIKVLAISMILLGIVSMWIKVPDHLLYLKLSVASFMIFMIFFILKQKSK